ncbi:hypothetical protein ALC53_07223 [Atta colombica]|uniref:Uncharacterized protein n=1 Tax=Atta colombica TaxID=520822 RepID=A0A195BCE6_9HYME|nr:hypothetical protein ALC53_07223 [Atta colombica]
MLSHHGAARAHRVETRPPSRPLSSGFARAPRYVYVRVRSVLTQRVGTVRCGAVQCVHAAPTSRSTQWRRNAAMFSLTVLPPTVYYQPDRSAAFGRVRPLLSHPATPPTLL